MPISPECKLEAFDRVFIYAVGGQSAVEMIARHCDPSINQSIREIATIVGTNPMRVQRCIHKAYATIFELGLWPETWKSPCRRPRFETAA